ncbi:MAG: phosphoglycerate kinase [Gemmatimonadales bacterium]
MKRTLESLEGQPLEGLRALVRVDFNAPLKDGRVADAQRVEAALPTVRWLCGKGCRVVLLSHLGRPHGRRVEEYSLRPVVIELERLLGHPVGFLTDPLADDALRVTKRMKRGDVILVENTRFFAGEERNEAELAASFARLGDFYVNDAFGTAHRAHASTEAVAHLLKPAVAGFLMERELTYLEQVMEEPERPFVAVLGGAKVSGKIEVIERLLATTDEILIGGAMACTFFLALGLEVGGSLVEPEKVDLATAVLERAGDRIVLPSTLVVAQRIAADTPTREVARDAIPEGWSVYDIGEATVALFSRHIGKAATVLWNGPLGVFETPPFDTGTMAVARALAGATERGATTIVGGGDSAAAVAQAGLAGQMTHISTGGGASLQLLEGKELPGVAALDDL